MSETRDRSRRVVITGLGVIAPNANGVAAFDTALRNGVSGIRKIDDLEEYKFGCQVAGAPQGVEELVEATFAEDERLVMNGGQRFASLAALEAWTDAGFERPELGDDRVHWETGAVIGTGIGGMDVIAERIIPGVDAKKVRRLGSACVEQVMASGVSARISGQLALGNQVTTNSSACSTGSEAIALGAERIRAGLAERMLCGGAEAANRYIWAGFDAMRVLSRKFNDDPTRASRPLSASAGGFVPGSGAGVVVLESLEVAEARGARIHAELLGAGINCGGHRAGGSMTAPNPDGVRRGIQLALVDAGIDPGEVDAINGHLTATGADPREVESWSAALGRGPGELPPLTATKSMVGHALGAAGGLEAVASVLMVRDGYLHPCLNCEDIHPEIEPFADSIPHETREMDLRVLIKASFGFGDVNACLVFRNFDRA